MNITITLTADEADQLQLALEDAREFAHDKMNAGHSGWQYRWMNTKRLLRKVEAARLQNPDSSRRKLGARFALTTATAALSENDKALFKLMCEQWQINDVRLTEIVDRRIKALCRKLPDEGYARGLIE